MKEIKKIKREKNKLRIEASKADLRDLAIISAFGLTMCATFGGLLFNDIDKRPEYTSTAIIMEDGNATIVDLESYEALDRSYTKIESWVLHTTNGNDINVNSESVQILTSEDSHEWAEEIAQELVSDGGEIIYYGKNTSKTLKLGL